MEKWNEILTSVFCLVAKVCGILIATVVTAMIVYCTCGSLATEYMNGHGHWDGDGRTWHRDR